MKLFTKEIDKKLFDQYEKGADLENQVVVAKIFNPYGRGTWYIINSDPSDPDYLWAIVDLVEVEIGSVSRMELETLKVPPFRLGLERDMSFTPKNALSVYRLLLKGKKFAEGGVIDWKDVYRGDSALVVAENKLGLVIKPYGRKFHLKFPDGTEKTYDASELKFIKSDDEYADGGVINRDLNMFVSKKAQEYAKQLKPQYFKVLMGQAVVDALGDANFHAEAKRLVVKFEGKKEWSDDLYQSEYYNSDDDVHEFAVQVSQKAQWDGTEIADAFIFAMKMTGLHSMAKQVEEVMNEEYAEGGMMADGGILPKIGSKVSGRWHDGMQWTSGTFKGETENGFEVYDFAIEKPDHIEYYSEISVNPYEGTKIFKSNYFKDRNYKNYHFLKEMAEGGMMAKGGKTKDEEVVYIEYLNKAKKFAKDKKEFKGEDGYKEAISWGRKNIPNFNPDMVKFKMAEGGMMAEGGEIKPEKPIDKMTKLELMRFVGKIDPTKHFYPKTTEAGRVQAKNIYDEYLSRKKMAKGGKVKFADKVASVKKSLLERKKVPKVVQKDYGKTFCPAEAEDSAKRIVGAQTARERLMARMKSKKKK